MALHRTKPAALILSLALLSSLAACGPADPQSSAEPSGAPEASQAVTDGSTETPPAPEPEPEPPDNSWQFATPEALGAGSGRFDEIQRRLSGSEMYAVVVVKDGVIVYEYYQDGYDETSLFPVHSVTKSVMGALIGIAIDQGLLQGVDQPLHDFFPELIPPDDEQRRAITVRHLLTHTSGLGHGDSGQGFQALVESENWVEHYLSLPMTGAPGTVFGYTTAGSHMLSAVLQQAAGRTAEDYAVEFLFTPIGIEDFVWDSDPQGVTDGGNGLHLSARDAARFGQLYLENGSWRGRQVVPRAWVEVSVQEHADGEADKGPYGYQLWLRSYGGGRYPGYYALGYAGQFVFVVPELDLVMAVTSRTIWSNYTAQQCIEEVVAAFTA